MIKTAGANVSPREVEAAIFDATGWLAHVVGVDDPHRGQLVAALVRVPSGTAPEPEVDDLRARLRDRLSAYKVPTRIAFVADGDIPMLSSGKLDARAVKERLDGGH
jgi:acyl-CoA synthetase (AMP-forming)/AMP-acid ligase II